MEHQLSFAQDQVRTAEQQRNELASKNRQLESEVASWTTAYKTQLASQTNPTGSSSTSPALGPSGKLLFPLRPQTGQQTVQTQGPPYYMIICRSYGHQ